MSQNCENKAGVLQHCRILFDFFSQFILLPKTNYHFWKAMNVVLFSLKVTKVICPVRIWSYLSKFIKQPPAFDSYSVQQTHFSFETYTQTHKLQFSDHLCSFMFLHKPALCAQKKPSRAASAHVLSV